MILINEWLCQVRVFSLRIKHCYHLKFKWAITTPCQSLLSQDISKYVYVFCIQLFCSNELPNCLPEWPECFRSKKHREWAQAYLITPHDFPKKGESKPNRKVPWILKGLKNVRACCCEMWTQRLSCWGINMVLKRDEEVLYLWIKMEPSP